MIQVATLRWNKVFAERARLPEGRILADNGIEMTCHLLNSVDASKALDSHFNGRRLTDESVSFSDAG